MRSRRHFVIDASALTPLFIQRKNNPGDVKGRAAMLKLIKLREDGKADLYVPNFCMAECAKAFARELSKKTKDPEIFHEQLHKYRDLLLETVSRSRKRIIQSVGLKRKHLESVEDIFTAEQKTDRRSEGDGLSGWRPFVIDPKVSSRELSTSSSRLFPTARRWSWKALPGFFTCEAGQ